MQSLVVLFMMMVAVLVVVSVECAGGTAGGCVTGFFDRTIASKFTSSNRPSGLCVNAHSSTLPLDGIVGTSSIPAGTKYC